MKIEGNVNVNGYLRIFDLHQGDAFAFENDSENLFMAIDDTDYYVNLETGEVFNSYNSEDKPIKKIRAKIVIED